MDQLTLCMCILWRSSCSQNMCVCCSGAAEVQEGRCSGGNGGMPADAPAAGAETAGDGAKRGRALQKKLRQIAALRERAAAGEALGAEQRGKLAAEPALLAELRELGIRE